MIIKIFFLFFKANPDGVVTVTFADVDQADLCREYMNNRIWHSRVIQCQNWDGKIFLIFFKNSIVFVLGATKYNATASTEEEKERIDEWHKYLNDGGDDE